MYDLERRFQARSVELPEANYYDTSPYAIDKNTDIDLAVDEQGLWAIYATEDNDGQIVISRLDPDTMEVLESFNTDFEKTTVMEAWMTCGILYAVARDAEHLLFMFDTSTGKHITGKTASKIRLPNLPAQTTSLKYDPKLRALQVWSHGTALTYQLRFQPRDMLYPTTTKSTTTKKTPPPAPTRPAITPKPETTNSVCPATQKIGLDFPEARFGQWTYVQCHGGTGQAKWLCGGLEKSPSWRDEPDMSECTSQWIINQADEVEKMTSGVELSRNLLAGMRQHRQSFRPFDLYVALDLVEKIREQNPRLVDQGLEQNLLQVIELVRGSKSTPAWLQLNQLAAELDSSSVSLVQSLLSRMSCKLRLNSQTYGFSDEANSFQCWLEPITTVDEESNFPVNLAFSRDVPKNAYRSLIKLTNGHTEWLGSLHTDCERPVSQWPVKYMFRNTVGSCSEPKNNGCKTDTRSNNGTICECNGSGGPVFLAMSSAGDDEVVPVPIETINPVDTALLAVLILAALLHGASGIASLLLKETSLVDVQGLHTAHRAINLLMMVGLITVSSTYNHMIKGELVRP